MRRQERPEASQPLLLRASSLRHRATAAAAAASAVSAGHGHARAVSTASARYTNPKRCCLRVREVTIITIIIAAAPEASVSEGGGQGEVVRGVGQELSDEVQVSRRAREAEGHGA